MEIAVSKIRKEQYGYSADGRGVDLFRFTSPCNMEIDIINYGAIITSIRVPDRFGQLRNVLLGFDNLDSYIGQHPFLGEVIGRFANRIAGGAFKIDNTLYELEKNDGDNHLHGGCGRFGRVLWDARITDEGAVALSYMSKDGEEGYPGNLMVTVTYSLNDQNELTIRYKAVTDKPTHLNLTSHGYFNLSGDFSSEILDHELSLNASRYTPVNNEQIPTGEIRSVIGSPFDFRNARPIGNQIHVVPDGYDHNFVLDRQDAALKMAATLRHPGSGIKMEIMTTEPGIQFYSGNSLNGNTRGHGGVEYKQYAGLCLEPQHFPDSPNQPSFPSTLLLPGEVYESTTIYRFGIE